MPLFQITWSAGRAREAKEEIRREISERMGRLAGVAPGFIAVLFTDLDRHEMNFHGAFVEVHISEGRSDAFKDGVAALATEAVCEYTGWTSEQVAVIIHDFRRGSIAVNGKIVNRSGPAAEAVISESGGSRS